ncbi:peroxisomal membrane protein PEX14 [Belonocnema kinseyi]|uniref:peroxisomal membrane protein PEX14 n=1 Tax=Belonocnema kinseyi TaxID=2817044 RepID=UPI00143CF2FC|nr:peroxisomal membrane protein PEX14 [Belonocnema kinseyi]
MTEQDTNNSVPLREQLITTAVKFLLNPKVVTSPVKQKQDFLRRKGLTEEEIQRACDLANVSIKSQNQNEFTTVTIPPSVQPYPYFQQHSMQSTLFYRIKEFFNVAALIGATVYCVYWFYKKFIAPFLFGSKRRDLPKDPVVELDQTIQRSMKEVKDSLSKMEDDVQKLTKSQSVDPTIPQLVQELKQDLASLKSLLLSKKQFPSAPPSIPSWQLDTSNQNQEKSTEREDDAGSGSSTNNSDSSLEMIREDPPKE